MPRFKGSGSRLDLNAEIVRLIGDAGLAYVFREISVGLPRNPVAVSEALRWIDDATLFEPETRLLLRAIAFAHRPAPNRYVRPAPAGNPDFGGERSYSSPEYPDEAVRLLALFRYWNMVQYFFPYRDVMDRDWVELLPELIPRFQGAASAVEYHLAVAEMTASVNDAHAYAVSRVLNDYWGWKAAPLRIRLIEGQSVVTRIARSVLDPAVDVRVGDVVTQIDGVPVETRRAVFRKYTHGSNDASLERNVHTRILLTNDESLALTLRRADGEPFAVRVNTDYYSTFYEEVDTFTGPLSAILPGNVGYINLGRLQVADVPNVMAQLRNTRGLILDVRNNANSTLFELANYLHPASRPFVKFTEPDFDYPGRFTWTKPDEVGPGSLYAPALTPATFTYMGKVAVLVDERTQSHGEWTTMGLRTAPGATVIGSQTAGADGNVSRFGLPGGISTVFSGLGVFYPDGTPTQRIGIVPDIVVKPTIQGLRDGRDEVLEAAVAFLR